MVRRRCCIAEEARSEAKQWEDSSKDQAGVVECGIRAERRNTERARWLLAVRQWHGKQTATRTRGNDVVLRLMVDESRYRHAHTYDVEVKRTTQKAQTLKKHVERTSVLENVVGEWGTVQATRVETSISGDGQWLMRCTGSAKEGEDQQQKVALG